MRYSVREGSQSVHCCFAATVVDTERPDLLGDGTQYRNAAGELQYESICECFTIADARLICAALNAFTPAKHRSTHEPDPGK